MTLFETEDAWTTAWLAPVADGQATMSERTLARIAARPGGVEAVCAAAQTLGVCSVNDGAASHHQHLLLLLLLRTCRGRARS